METIFRGGRAWEKFATTAFFDKLEDHKTYYGGKFTGSLVPVFLIW